MKGRLGKGLRRLAKPWMGCSLNLGIESPVRTKPHKDGQCAIEGRSCLCCFGDFRGGHIVFWEIKAILELSTGDVLLFADHLLTHSNTDVQGIRHSMVAFTHQKVIDWLMKRHGFVNGEVTGYQKGVKNISERQSEGK